MRKLVAILLLLTVACSGNKDGTTPKNTPTQTDATPTQDATDNGSTDNGSMVIEGDLGEIDQQAVQKKFDDGQDDLMKCIMDGRGNLRYVGGDMSFVFRIALDGSVKWLKMRSTVGNRGVEKCIYDWASSLKFVKPKGGEAQVSYSWGFDPELTPKLRWGEDEVGGIIAKARRRLRRCSDGTPQAPASYHLVFYVIPGGEVTSLGISTGDLMVSDDFYRCVEKVIKKLHFPDTMGRVAKAELDFSI